MSEHDPKTPYSYERLCQAPAREMEALMDRGQGPAFEDLAGWEFRGYNPNPATDLVGIRKFKKGFYRDPGDPEVLWGYNVKVRQNGFANPWVAQLRSGEPVRHGLYQAYPVRPGDRDHRYPAALLLNYGLGNNPLLDVTRVLRDYLVAVNPGSSDLLLGRAFIALGPLRLDGGYFVLERYNRVF